MNKVTLLWSVEELQTNYPRISFPEYQREPNVWAKAAKQRLIDSILREFDISSVYIYDNKEDGWDCIDGQQRLGAIMSFLGQNPEDSDNGFELRVTNEIYEEIDNPFSTFDGMRFAEIAERGRGGDPAAKDLAEAVMAYLVTIVQLSGSRRPEEFNLQFARLNVGTIINSGEKLHAMVGELRDICFNANGLGAHAFLENTRIPTRRYSREQLAAQLVAQVLARSRTGEWTRTRHFDLQRLFKEHTRLDANARDTIASLEQTLTSLQPAFAQSSVLRNRAITVSAVLLAWELRLDGADVSHFTEFIEEFACRLQWQVGKGLDVDPEYRYLVDFQRHVTQASVEKPAVVARHEVLSEEFERWQRYRVLRGDQDYYSRTGRDASEDCQA